MDRFKVHTNFTGTVKQVYSFQFAELAAPSHLDVLRRLFTEPNSLRPDQTTARVTEQAAERKPRLAARTSSHLQCEGVERISECVSVEFQNAH